MLSREISLDSPPDKRPYTAVRLDRLVLVPIIVGLLTAVSILVLIYQENRAVQYRIEATEVWSAYQMKIVRAAIEEDPDLKAQYIEEQDVLHQDAQDLRERSTGARNAVVLSAYAALVLLLGAATAVGGLFANSVHAGYAGMILGIIGVGLGIKALF